MFESKNQTQINQTSDFSLIEVKDGKIKARNLYKFLGLAKATINRWLKTNIENNSFAFENEDFWGFNTMLNGNKIQDYYLSIDFAKKISMQSKTEMGEKARNYFLTCEEKLKELSLPSYQISNPIERAEKWIQEEKQRQELSKLLSEAKPKVEFYDKVAEAKNKIEMSGVAKIVGLGRTKLFALLRDKKILRWNNEPYQEYVDKGWFETLVQVFQDGKGNERINRKTMVTPKGVQAIDKRVNKFLDNTSLKKTSNNALSIDFENIKIED